jgi:four helix bundle protein
MEIRKIKLFKDLIVWQKAAESAVVVYSVTEKFPQSELYGLTNQMRRAVISITSNIAEGFRRKNPREKRQFYRIADGSLSELESQVEVSHRLKYVPEEDYLNLLSRIDEISRMLSGLISSVAPTY